jgi:putative hemolysin
MIIFLVIALVVLLGISAYSSASETSLFSLSSMKVRAFQQGRDPRGRIVAKLLSCSRKLLVTILIVNVFVNILVQNVVSSIFGSLSGWFYTVGIPLILSLVFGEVIPKALAISNNTRIALSISRSLYIIEKLLTPIRFILVPVTSAVSRFTYFFLKYRTPVSHEELKHALSTSKEFGHLNQSEAKLLRGFLNLEDDVVKEIMCPRQDILYYNLADPLDALHTLFVDKECSRVPVCRGDLEEMVGIVSATDYFVNKRSILDEGKLERYCTKSFYIPESTTCRRVLSLLYERGDSMAIIVDEYGAISGLVTNEDLEEVVVGQITDPRRDEESHYVTAGEGVVIASGKLELAEFEEIFDSHLESPNNMATIGGWLTEMMGDIPKEGEKYETDEFLFHVLSSDQTKVVRVYIRKL